MGRNLQAGGGLDGRVSVGAVLLAAGAGERLGRRPKSLLELDGVPLIRRQLHALAGAGIDEIVVVLGHHARLIEPAVEASPVTVIHNPDPDNGLVSSQRIGLATLTSRLNAVIVALADQPLIDVQDITDLIGAWQKRPAGTSVVVPEVAGVRGNPVIFSAGVRAEILAGAADFGGRQWQQRHPAQVAPFASDNRHYRVDIDTAQDLLRFEHETGLVLRWPAGLA